MPDEASIATFFTTHAALRAEKVLKEMGVPAKLTPAPRHLSTDCTAAICFPRAYEERVREILRQYAIESSGIHCLGSN